MICLVAVRVGDSLEADIKEAIKSGLEAVYFDPDGTSTWNGYKIQLLRDLPMLLRGMCG